MGLLWVIPLFWGVGGAPGRGLYRCEYRSVSAQHRAAIGAAGGRCSSCRCTGAVGEPGWALPAGEMQSRGTALPRPVSPVASLRTGGSATRSVACPQGFCGCKAGISVPNWCHSECQQPAGSEWPGSGSREVIICPGSETAGQGDRYCSVPTLGQGWGGSLPWEHSARGQGGDLVAVEG